MEIELAETILREYGAVVEVLPSEGYLRFYPKSRLPYPEEQTRMALIAVARDRIGFDDEAVGACRLCYSMLWSFVDDDKADADRSFWECKRRGLVPNPEVQHKHSELSRSGAGNREALLAEFDRLVFQTNTL